MVTLRRFAGPLVFALLSACVADDADLEGGEGSESSGDGDLGDGDGDSGDGDSGDGDSGDGDGDGDGEAEGLPGPFVYSERDPEGRLMIDALFVLTQDAVAEIESGGESPEAFLDWRIDDLNGALARSLVDSSAVRSLGVHVLDDPDYERVGAWPGPTDSNDDYALAWLGSYRSTYGADKILIIGSTAESQSGAAWGGGDVSSYWVDFLPINHEFGHCMGGAHCNEGDPEAYNFGFPLAGYDDQGMTNPPGLMGGTMMCGNNVNFFSNPDVVLSLEEIQDYVDLGMMPAQDYAAALGPEGELQLGHPVWANMAQTWRDNELGAAERFPSAKYPGIAGEPYEKDDCAAFYSEEGYGGTSFELCAGDQAQNVEDQSISSVRVGREVHVNLYTDAQFGAGSSCGGILQRLAFSSPSVGALSQHHGRESIDDAVAAVAVYPPLDRDAHALFEGSFAFYSSGDLPYCSTVDGETLTLMRDGVDWTGTAALLESEFAPPFTIEFEYASLHVGDNPPADGISVFFAKDPSSYLGTPPPRGSLGFIPDGSGYAIELNLWTNNVALRDGNYEVVGQAANVNTYTDGAWVPVVIEVLPGSVSLSFDGQELVSEQLALDPSFEGIGLGAGTGAYSADFSVRNFKVTPG